MPEVIVCRNIAKIFNKDKPNEVKAVNNVSLKIQQGEVVVIKGPSGSGKTTLVAMLGCMSRPTSGDIFVLENRVSKWTEKFLTLFRRRHIGFIFQNFNLINGLTTDQNIILPLLPAAVNLQNLSKRTVEIARRLGIEHRLRFKVDSLSGGEMQRVAIARALIANPEILIADEPTAHLDTHLSRQILNIFKELKQDGKTVIIATHDPLVFESDLVDRVICMRDGHLVTEDC